MACEGVSISVWCMMDVMRAVYVWDLCVKVQKPVLALEPKGSSSLHASRRGERESVKRGAGLK